MKRVFVLALGLLFVPAVVSAQVEIGVDAGLGYTKVTDQDDAVINFGVPVSGVRIGFMGGETIVIETLFDLGYTKVGDFSGTGLGIVPGVNFLLGEQFYVRGEAGLAYAKSDNGTTSSSSTQYMFGGAAGIRRALGDGALLRLEAGLDRTLENSDDGIPSSWDFRLVAGVSAVIG